MIIIIFIEAAGKEEGMAVRMGMKCLPYSLWISHTWNSALQWMGEWVMSDLKVGLNWT